MKFIKEEKYELVLSFTNVVSFLIWYHGAQDYHKKHEKIDTYENYKKSSTCTFVHLCLNQNMLPVASRHNSCTYTCMCQFCHEIKKG